MPADSHTFSVAMTADLDGELRHHLDRVDGQEDICVATYARSTGATRRSAILTALEHPRSGEREVHGNATITGAYVLRVARLAAARGEGIAILHSHPSGIGWQGLGRLDFDAESSYARLAEQITGLPLLGMTLGTGDASWSARVWPSAASPVWAENVRVVGDTLRVSWNDRLRPVPQPQPSQARTVSAWGLTLQASIARLRILVVGVGSIGMDVAQRLAAAGIEHVDVMDFDTVKTVNLDRLIGATRRDAALARSKASVAARLIEQASTARHFRGRARELSVCEPDGQAAALDYDLIFSCVDRPWARGVLNAIAHADLIPIIDAGVSITPFDDGTGMRGATFRTQVVRPGRPCLMCSGQVDPGELAKERSGALDDPRYIQGAADQQRSAGNENVSLISASASAHQLAQFVSFLIGPGGQGEPGPLRFNLVTHALTPINARTHGNCRVEHRGRGDNHRSLLAGDHWTARREAAAREAIRRRPSVRFREAVDRVLSRLLGLGAT
jgi:hypothetical protein